MAGKRGCGLVSALRVWKLERILGSAVGLLFTIHYDGA